MKTRLFMAIAVALIALTAIISCGAHSDLSSWRDPNFKTNGFDKIFVMVRSDNLQVRSEIENSIIEELGKSGVTGIASLNVLSPNEERSQEDLEGTFDSLGVDGIMIVRPIGQEDQLTYVPETTYYRVYHDVFYGRYIEEVTEGGYWEKTGELYRTRTDLFSNQTDRLVWQATSETTYDGDLESSADAFARTVAKDLREEALIPETSEHAR